MQCCNKLQKQCKKKGGVSKCYKQYFWLSSVEQVYICFGVGKHSHVKQYVYLKLDHKFGNEFRRMLLVLHKKNIFNLSGLQKA